MDLGGEGAYSVLEQPESAFSQALAQAAQTVAPSNSQQRVELSDLNR